MTQPEPKSLLAEGRRLLRRAPTGPAARAFERAQDRLERALLEVRLEAKSVADWERRLARQRVLVGATLRRLEKALGLPRGGAGSDAERVRACRKLGARATLPQPLRHEAQRRATDLAGCTRYLADSRKALARRQAAVEARAGAWLQARAALPGKAQ